MLLPATLIYRSGITQRLHNRRVALIVTPAGEYQFHIKKLLEPGELEELLADGYQNRIADQIIRGKIRYSVLTFTREAWEAMVACQVQMSERERRRKNF